VICDELGINVWELIELANHHPRVDILEPGPGVEQDAASPWTPGSSSTPPATGQAHPGRRRRRKPTWVLGRIEDAIGECGEGATVALLGLAFQKANIDDLRGPRLCRSLSPGAACRQS
jgi:UDP-N-acetyl-D-mannosaminuronic acid dehydrogenase